MLYYPICQKTPYLFLLGDYQKQKTLDQLRTRVLLLLLNFTLEK
jgi:hypothetical protein